MRNYIYNVNLSKLKSTRCLSRKRSARRRSGFCWSDIRLASVQRCPHM